MNESVELHVPVFVVSHNSSSILPSQSLSVPSPAMVRLGVHGCKWIFCEMTDGQMEGEKLASIFFGFSVIEEYFQILPVRY